MLGTYLRKKAILELNGCLSYGDSIKKKYITCINEIVFLQFWLLEVLEPYVI